MQLKYIFFYFSVNESFSNKMCLISILFKYHNNSMYFLTTIQFWIFTWNIREGKYNKMIFVYFNVYDLNLSM